MVRYNYRLNVSAYIHTLSKKIDLTISLKRIILRIIVFLLRWYVIKTYKNTSYMFVIHVFALLESVNLNSNKLKFASRFKSFKRCILANGLGNPEYNDAISVVELQRVT